MKDLGKAIVILGILIVRNIEGIVLIQSHYIEKILKMFSHLDCKHVPTSYDRSMKIFSNTRRVVDQLEYARVIGCLMYAMTCTRPDITFVVGKLSKYTSNTCIFIGLLYIGF